MADLLRKYKSLYSSTANSFGTGTGVTITPGSVVGLPTTTEITLTFDRVTSAGVATPSLMERIIGTISGGNLPVRTSPSSGRGADGSTEQSHTSPVVEMIWNAKDWNDLVDWAVTEHNQDGSHKKVTGMDNNTAVTQKDSGGTARAIAKLNSNNVLEHGGKTAAQNSGIITDSGSANAYAVTMTPVPAAYETGMELTFKAANANTTASTLNVNSLGTKTIKRYGTTDVQSGDIQANQLVTVVYDGTNFLIKGFTAVTQATDGWIADSNTWTYSSADGATGVLTINADLTGVIQAGDRIKLTQTTAKYFLVTKTPTFGAGSTTLTIWGGSDYTLANAAITSPYYSHIKNPFGFNLDPLKWTVETRDTSARTQGSPGNGTWYNLSSISIDIPIGEWKVSYQCVAEIQRTGTTYSQARITLSTANNSQSDSDMTSMVGMDGGSLTNPDLMGNCYREKYKIFTSKTTHYLNMMTTGLGDNLIERGDLAPTIIRATSAYL